MYTENQKLDTANRVTLSRTGKTLAVCSENNVIKIYKQSDNSYELDKEISTSDVHNVAVTDSLLLASDNIKNEVHVYAKENNDWTKQSVLKIDDEKSDFGFSIAASDDSKTIVIGALYDTNKSRKTGSVYVFIQNDNEWVKQDRLVAQDGEDYDWFGSSVAISSDGNTVITGANGDDYRRGSAYVFAHINNKWVQQAKLTAPDGELDDEFGWSVAISSDGNTAIVGANKDDDDKGSAYVFIRKNNIWSLQDKLTAPDGESGDEFGSSVAISSDGNTAIIGAYHSDTDEDNSFGSAYVFVRNNDVWTLQNKLTSPHKAIGDWFGWSVAISDDSNTAVVGIRRFDDDTGTSSGSAYVFTATN